MFFLLKTKTAMPSYRCSAIVLDKETKRNRKCKKSFKFIFDGCQFCTIHASIAISSYVLTIQSCFRAYLVRRKIKYLKKLPDELQRKIVTIEREEFFNSIFNYKLSNFLIKKFVKTVKMYIEFTDISYNYTNDILRILYLRHKYFSIIKNVTEYYTDRIFFKNVSLEHKMDNLSLSLKFQFLNDPDKFSEFYNITCPEFQHYFNYCLDPLYSST